MARIGSSRPDHAPDLARPQTAGVHHVLGVHVALIGDHIPGAVGARLQVGHAGMPHDLGAADLRGLGVGVGHAVRIDVPFDRIVHRAREVPLVHEREQPGRLVDRNDFEIHAEIAAARLRHLQPVEPLARAGEHDAAGDVHAAGLTGDLLDLLVEIDGVLLQLRDVRIAVDGVHAARRMPGRSGRQLRPLDQQHVLPAGLRQVIQDARADDAAADHHHLRVAFHDNSDFSACALTHWIPPNGWPGSPCPIRCRSARSATSGTRRSRYRSALPDE